MSNPINSKTATITAPGSIVVPAAQRKGATPARTSAARPETIRDRVENNPSKTNSQLEKAARNNAAGGAITSATLSRAKEKLSLGVDALLEAAKNGVGSGSIALMIKDAQQGADKISSAKNTISSHFDSAIADTKNRIKAIKKHIDSLSKSSFWSSLGSIFKKIATVATAVAGFVSGNPLLIAAAALLLMSVITSQLPLGSAGVWISQGLALGAAALGGFSGLVGSATSAAANTVKTAANVGSTIATGVSSGAKAMSDSEQAKATKAQAVIQEIKARTQKNLNEANSKRREIEEIQKSTDKSVDQLFNLLNSAQRADMASVRA